jgi:uncharacterized membrane protein
VFKLSYLWRGLPGHPLHPPLTDATIGAYTVAFGLAIANCTGLVATNAAKGWWLALVLGLIFTVVTALTGFLDWLQITWRTPLWWTATWHMLVMLTATVCFAISAAWGHAGYVKGDVAAGPFALTVVGFCVMAVGGWLGGTIVFVYGMRVLNLVDEPPTRAAAPIPHQEKRAAEES